MWISRMTKMPSSRWPPSSASSLAARGAPTWTTRAGLSTITAAGITLSSTCAHETAAPTHAAWMRTIMSAVALLVFRVCSPAWTCTPRRGLGLARPLAPQRAVHAVVEVDLMCRPQMKWTLITCRETTSSRCPSVSAPSRWASLGAKCSPCRCTRTLARTLVTKTRAMMKMARLPAASSACANSNAGMRCGHCRASTCFTERASTSGSPPTPLARRVALCA
mmetsp:Transcript_8735/g.25776  ORF Transcript_8735/g.25776 Transcript_8735/m.25776 type:complete len:221 (-) Transcript_8735:228-890(-)